MTDPYALRDHLDRAWLIACSRCSAEGVDFSDLPDMASYWLHGLGWSWNSEDRRVYCPACNKETSND